MRRSLAGLLALASIVLGGLGAALAFDSPGSLTGLVLLGAAIPVAVAGWIALGAPVRHRHAASEG